MAKEEEAGEVDRLGHGGRDEPGTGRARLNLRER